MLTFPFGVNSLGVSAAFRTSAKNGWSSSCSIFLIPLLTRPFPYLAVLEKDAVIKGAAALHVRIGSSASIPSPSSSRSHRLPYNAGHRNSGSPKPSVATQIGYLRSLLLASSSDDDDFSHSSSSSSTNYFALVAAGRLPLVAHTDKADIIATLINLKKQVDAASGREGKWIMCVLLSPLSSLSMS